MLYHKLHWGVTGGGPEFLLGALFEPPLALSFMSFLHSFISFHINVGLTACQSISMTPYNHNETILILV